MKNGSLLERIAGREQLGMELESLQAEKSKTKKHLQSIQRGSQEIRNRIAGLSPDVQRYKSNGEQHEGYRMAKRNLDEAERQLRDHAEEITEFKNRYAGIEEREGELKTEIAEYDTGASRSEVLAYGKALEEARSKADKLRSLIAEQEAILSENNDIAEAQIEVLQQQRETLLANIATGEAKTKELETLDAEIASLVNDKDGSQAVRLEKYRSASQTVRGLRHKLTDAEDAFTALQIKTPLILEQFIISEAERIGSEYVEHAELIAQLFIRLKVLDDMVSKITGGSRASMLSSNWHQFFLPSLQLKSVYGTSPEHAEQGALFSIKAAQSLGTLKDQKAVEIEQLCGLGFKEFFTATQGS